ncbi:MAG: phosphoribosylformylglycinamidine synthase, partial [Nitrospirota bacterium]
MPLLYLYRRPALSGSKNSNLLGVVRQKVSEDIKDIATEHCFYIESTAALTPDEYALLKWLLSETFEQENFSNESFLTPNSELPWVVDRTPNSILETGPRMNFTTAWSTNAVSVCHACGLTKVTRIERSRRYRLISYQLSAISGQKPTDFLNLVHDRMTECRYAERLTTFETRIEPEPVYEVKVLEEGKAAIEKINKQLGLGLDEWDVDYYYGLFVNDMKRNPTNVECFDLGQSNSEHSRHWFFRGRLVIDGITIPHTLMEIIKRPYNENPNNSVIAFKDNSSAIRGYKIKTIIPERPGRLSRFVDKELTCHITFTAETHNFPTGVAPFPGAETGTGGRIRDVQAVGRGGLVIAGTAAYCVGNLHIPGYCLPWEDESFEYPKNLASPLQIEIEASNGASDYGNKFGEPLIQGYTRSFGMVLPNGERREWIKPIMFTGGVGQMDERHVEKGELEKGMLVVKVGGPAYRIGIGGGAASSMIQGENIEELDFNAVQRGDAEMEQKLNRVIRACVEMGSDNPIISIHDQGAGGNCNVIKELVYPAGARIDIRKIPLGDNTLSVLEIWGAEYQESNALLIRPEKRDIFEGICKREKVPSAIVGTITGDGYIVLFDEKDKSTPVKLDLKKVLGEMPQKRFTFDRIRPELYPVSLPEGITVRDALERVLRLVSVGSKRFLTNKVDRSVTGLIAQQQCTGPLHLTVSDVAVIAQSHFGTTGAAISIGEQPVKGLINPASMARMAVAEAITNIVWAKVSALEDIRCSGNWMWPAKLPGEGAALYDAAMAMMEIMQELGIAVDGGKDSISMAAVVRNNQATGHEIVKAPGSLVISAYTTCPDITKVITPDIKQPGISRLLYIDLAKGKKRLGGSSIAQVYCQLGDESPDIDDPGLLKRVFMAVQKLIEKGLILSGHDISDGGLIVTLLEMAFSGNCGIYIEIEGQGARVKGQEREVIEALFSEEAGLVIEYKNEKEDEITMVLKDLAVPFHFIGTTLVEKKIKINLRTQDSELQTLLDEDMQGLRAVWEETSYQLERLQSDPDCAEEERKNIYERKGPPFILT